eukprot:TRINITY_DN5752_c0_g1_i4.p1 TRINITY_DN5752_c0_g1~~TRINITY_DN5752_c0_g1_i4.p1  ORF type:complete len:307 (-),score=35.75 TRINITY_DN5752_c0_g1_i4:547-1446(-)
MAEKASPESGEEVEVEPGEPEPLTDVDQIDVPVSRHTSVASHTELGLTEAATLPCTWTLLKFKKPKKPEGDVLKRYSPPALTSSSLVGFNTDHQKLLCLFGGVTDCKPTNDVWLYDVGNKKWTAIREGQEDSGDRSPQALQRQKLRAMQGYSSAFPQARCGHCAAVVPPKEMYVFGGANICTASYYNDLWTFDIELYEWRHIPAKGILPSPRWQSSLVTVEDRLFLYAGEGQNYTVLDDLHIFCHTSHEWLPIRTVHPSPPARMMHGCCGLGDNMFVVGGVGKTPNSDVWQLDTSVYSF